MRYRYEDPEEWGSNPHREALKQMDEQVLGEEYEEGK